MGRINSAWDQPTSGQPDTYNFRYGLSSGGEGAPISLPGTQQTYTFPATPNTYYMTVTAVTGGVETGPSNEFILTVVPSPSVPQAVETVFASTGNDDPSVIHAGQRTWDILYNGSVIATSDAPAGWQVAFDGSQLYVMPPQSATIDVGYEARYHVG